MQPRPSTPQKEQTYNATPEHTVFTPFYLEKNRQQDRGQIIWQNAFHQKGFAEYGATDQAVHAYQTIKQTAVMQRIPVTHIDF